MVFCLRFMMHGELSSCSSGHSGCCSPAFGEKESSKFRDVSEISGHSGCCSHAFGEKESSKFRDVSEITPWPKVSTRSLRCHYR